MKNQNGFTAVALLLAIIYIGGIGGWVWNIVKLAGMDFGAVTGMLVLRAIGIIAAPLGAVLGYL